MRMRAPLGIAQRSPGARRKLALVRPVWRFEPPVPPSRLPIAQLRDLRNVAGKLRLVLLPTGSPEQTLKELRNWDLWGPLLLCLVLSL